MAKCVLRNVTIAFVNLVKPKPVGINNDLKHSVCLLFKKDGSDEQNLKILNLTVRETAQAGLSKKWNNVAPKNYSPVKDGDGVDSNGNPYKGILVGHYFLNASSKERPGIVDEFKVACLDEKKFYPGCKVNISLDFYAYNANGKKGITARIVNVMWAGDGQRLGGDPTPEEDFADIPSATKPTAETAPQDKIDFGLDEDLPF